MVAYVVIPGIDGSDEKPWQTMWGTSGTGRGTHLADVVVCARLDELG
ncbi:hypothetical protein [Gordonia effusa]|nr:hypothetical protein [Gordonia effusa]